MTFVSYAQNFEDVLLWRALGKRGPGFYIDVGAAHPDVDSVTRAFYDRGWHGINVDPVEDDWRRLQASRPRDVNLCLALGETTGRGDFYVVPGTGLSTMRPEMLPAVVASGRKVETTTVQVETLAELCRRYAPADIHFLKIDVEGAEREVLLGADFRAFRPWVVLVEATAPMSTVEAHAEWEGILLAADYRFVWFDGLNRFYVAVERHAELAPAFRTPPNVFDDFLRAADTEWARRINQAETLAQGLLARVNDAEARLQVSESNALAETVQLREARVATARARAVAQARADEIERLRIARARAEQSEAQAQARTQRAEARAELARNWLTAMCASTSWRLTQPLRWVLGRVRGSDLEAPPAEIDVPTTLPDTERVALSERVDAGLAPERLAVPRPARLRRAVHQFHSGSAVGDAITNAMLLTRDLLRQLGYASEIFVEHLDPALADELHHLDELPLHDDYVLILRHSTGYEVFDRVVALPAPKVLIYHNITPPQFLGDDVFTQRYAGLGRTQLATLHDRVAAALADSEYNALELRRLGFAAPRTCTLLFDVEALLAEAARHPPTRNDSRDRVFTILFVGRIIESKAQLDLVEAFARFHAAFDRPSRLVLVGRSGNADDKYLNEVTARMRAHGIEAHVTLTGLVSDEVLHRWYASADLYVSLSHHEGFGVPLVEAVAHGLPVLAWPSGAVPYTLGDAAELLQDRAPQAVAARMLELARDPARRASIAERQRHGLRRFPLHRQTPYLIEALTLAGAAPPEHEDTAALLAASMRFTIAGHVNKTYSLASINRAVALALEAERPGRVRVIPVEGEPTLDLSEVPPESRAPIAALVARGPHATGPEIVISQHYPLHVPENAGDACLALFFWEELLVPADTVARLNQSFRAVLTASRFVAKALVDSGLSIPVHVIGHAPWLEGFRALARRRPDPAGLARARREDVFTFLHVSSCFPRKGIDVLLAAYARAFRGGDRVRLVIKGFPNPHNDAAAQIARLRARDPDAPEIELIDRDLDEAGLLDLYARADAMVLPSRGEGFNLPAAEAMAAGLPVIVTGFGGHLDFCGPDTARLVAWRFAASGSHLATPHSVWVEPDVDDLAAALLEAVRSGARDPGLREPSLREPGVREPGGQDGNDGLPARRARRALAVADERFGQVAFVRRLTDAALRVLLSPPAAPLRLGWISTWQVRCGVAEYSRHLLANVPPSLDIEDIVVLADQRTPAAPADVDAIRVRPAWEFGHPEGIAGLLLAIAQEDPRVVVLQHQPGLFHWGVLTPLLAGLADRLVVVTLHNTRDILDVPESERRLAVAAMAGIARVVVHTLADLNRLRELGLIDNVMLLPHGVPAPLPGQVAAPARALARDAAGRTPGDLAGNMAGDDAAAPLIGCYGFFLPDKGIGELVAALALVRRDWPHARLRLVNADYGSPEFAAEIAGCRAAAEQAGVADGVEWCTDFLPDERSLGLLAECDVVVLPYQRSKEASSAALRMALASGAPVMVTDLPLFDEAGDAVARCPGVSSEAIAAALSRLLADREARARLQEAGRRWVGERDWAIVARRFQGMLLGLAAQASPQRPAVPARDEPQLTRDRTPALVAPNVDAVA